MKEISHSDGVSKVMVDQMSPMRKTDGGKIDWLWRGVVWSMMASLVK